MFVDFWYINRIVATEGSLRLLNNSSASAVERLYSISFVHISKNHLLSVFKAVFVYRIDVLTIFFAVTYFADREHLPKKKK